MSFLTILLSIVEILKIQIMCFIKPPKAIMSLRLNASVCLFVRPSIAKKCVHNTRFFKKN